MHMALSSEEVILGEILMSAKERPSDHRKVFNELRRCIVKRRVESIEDGFDGRHLLVDDDGRGKGSKSNDAKSRVQPSPM